MAPAGHDLKELRDFLSIIERNVLFWLPQLRKCSTLVLLVNWSVMLKELTWRTLDNMSTL